MTNARQSHDSALSPEVGSRKPYMSRRQRRVIDAIWICQAAIFATMFVGQFLQAHAPAAHERRPFPVHSLFDDVGIDLSLAIGAIALVVCGLGLRRRLVTDVLAPTAALVGMTALAVLLFVSATHWGASDVRYLVGSEVVYLSGLAIAGLAIAQLGFIAAVRCFRRG